MGSDDLFRKLKAKASKKKSREIEKKEPYSKFLIVCEDTVSGYHYLLECIKHFRLSSANFHLVGLGQDPLNIVKEAERILKEESRSHKPDFDFAFCVFDRDEHSNYYNAINKIASLNKNQGSKCLSINSNPCFELWLLLHFVYTTKSFDKTQNKTAAKNVEAELKQHFPNYTKSNRKIFQETFETALGNAEKLERYCNTSFVDVPFTNFHTLMKFIMSIKKS